VIESLALGQLPTEFASCLFCDAVSASPAARGWDYEYDTSSDLFDLVQCSGCGLMFVQPRIFGNLKTWLRGTFHGVSPKHLQRYLGEFTYRLDRRWREGELFGFVLRRVGRGQPLPLPTACRGGNGIARGHSSGDRNAVVMSNCLGSVRGDETGSPPMRALLEARHATGTPVRQAEALAREPE